MRIVPFLISTAITIGLVVVLNMQLTIGSSKTPRLGNFLSPQMGFWQNAEAEFENYSIDIHSKQLQDRVDVYLDDRLVPHVFAQNEHDVFFVQGYLHARFRLWQMEFQTHAAAGRLAEVLGEKIGNTNILELNDRRFRRLGMGIAAEKALKEMEANPDSKMVFDAYRDGVNNYIDQLKPENYPLEYKLLDYKPEHWTNLKTAYFLKYMSFDLAGYEEDFEMTNAKKVLSKSAFELAYPLVQDSLDPIVPKGTIFEKPGIVPKIPATADSLYFTYIKDSNINRESSVAVAKRESSDVKGSSITGLTNDSRLTTHDDVPNKANGSNNWAVAGSKTASGKPILCGDPHLGLNLPSLWYEMQLHTPKWNVYGATFPGAPAVPIGFNDSIAWSETNAMRDVRDYYDITFKDNTENEYQFNGSWNKTEWRYDTIKVRGKADFIDSIPMTVFGPVMYENRYGTRQPHGKAYAVHWKALDPSNDGWTFLKLARSKNYNDYLNAISTFTCPGQNFVFASKSGDIAIWNQGVFPAKWHRQGDFVMPGTDSSYMWQGMIPQNENPHVVNPVRGFVSSANQLPVDSTYKYYLGGNYPVYRGIEINKKLSAMTGITPRDMEHLQTDNYNIFAAAALPLLLRNVDSTNLNDEEKEYLGMIKQWNYKSDVDEKGPTIFNKWFNALSDTIYNDEINHNKNLRLIHPDDNALVEALLRDTAYLFVNNINTPQKETLKQMVTAAWHKAAKQVGQLQRDKGYITWSKVKDSEIDHLLKIPALSSLHLNIGGGENIINATGKQHGPSWRMVVSMTAKTEAYGVYPGGQNGNPGSKFYDSFVETWAAGKYNKLWVMEPNEANDSQIRWRITFSN